MESRKDEQRQRKSKVGNLPMSKGGREEESLELATSGEMKDIGKEGGGGESYSKDLHREQGKNSTYPINRSESW